MPETHTTPRFAVPSREESVDPELLALPHPRRTERGWTLALLAVTLAASLVMAGLLLADARYLAATGTPIDVGDLRSAPASVFENNRLVAGAGVLGAAGAIRFDRPFESGSHRVLPLLGRDDLWVEVYVPDGMDNGRFMPPTRFSGRLVRFDDAGPRRRGLRQVIAERAGVAVPAGAWLLVSDEAPGQARWALALVALFVAFAAWNAVAMVRIVRPAAAD